MHGLPIFEEDNSQIASIVLNMPLFRVIYNPLDPLVLYLPAVRSAGDAFEVVGDFHVPRLGRQFLVAQALATYA